MESASYRFRADCCVPVSSLPTSTVDGHLAEASYGVGEKNGVGGFQVFEMQDLLLHIRPRCEQVPPVDSRQQTARDGRRKPEVILPDEDIADGAFGDLS